MFCTFIRSNIDTATAIVYMPV